MAAASDAPADTTMMRIVHDALRRDLARASSVLADPGRATTARLRAVGSHLVWMMGFLHAHHRSEDEGLYPLARQRAYDDARALLDRMSRGHSAIASVIADVEAAASALASDGSPDAAAGTSAALAALDDLLLPHLHEEEVEAMPIVSRLVTAAEWQSLERKHNLDPKPMSELGFEGHWLIDGATAADRTAVVSVVPPIPRFVLLRGFARRYRRHAAACWGRDDPLPRRVQLENRVEVTVEADIDEVWSVVVDVTRVGEWSHECVGAEWLGEARAPAAGVRFRGRNRAGVLRWGRVCEIVSAEPYELVWITVPTALYPDSSEWRIALTKVDEGTRICQQFQVRRAPEALAVLFAVLIPTHRDRTSGLVEDLQRLGRVASRSSAAA